MLALNTIITLEIRCDPINSLNCSFNLLFSDTFNSLINFTLYSLLLLLLRCLQLKRLNNVVKVTQIDQNSILESLAQGPIV